MDTQDIGSQQNERIRLSLSALAREISVGNTHFKIWKGLYNEIHGQLHSVIWMAAPNYFSFSLFAHLDAALLHAAKVIDRHRESLSIQRVIELVRASGSPAKDILVDLESRVALLERPMKALLVRRDKALAHLDQDFVRNPTKVFKSMRIENGEVENFFETASGIVNAISQAHSNELHVTEASGNVQDFEHVFLLIKRGQTRTRDV